MGKLRAYHWNKGDMLDLVRYQKTVREAEQEDKIFPAEILRSCSIEHIPNGKYYEKM
ncbi:MAG: hypothetical protein ACOX4R_07040 [Lentihominibacter sp.]|jgi:hypothetical protein